MLECWIDVLDGVGSVRVLCWVFGVVSVVMCWECLD